MVNYLRCLNLQPLEEVRFENGLDDEELLEMIKNDKHLLITRNLDLGFPMESHELYSPLTLREMKKRKVKGHYTNYELKEALKLGALLWTNDKNPDFEVVVYLD